MLGGGEASGEKRVLTAAVAAISNPLIEDARPGRIGRKVSGAWVANVLAADAPKHAPDTAFAPLMEGRTVLDLAEGLQLRRVQVMGAYRIELSGFTDPMRDRLRPTGSSGRSSRGSCACSCRLTPAAPKSWPRCSIAIQSSASPNGRPRDDPRCLRAGTSPRARGRSGVSSLSNGKREGRYWVVGDVHNTPGRSMCVRLRDSPKGPAGKWTEYVAPRVMLRICAWELSHRRLTASTQHNASALREVA
jgi:hypothetical protein